VSHRVSRTSPWPDRLRDRVAIVTGAAQGIGRAIARVFAAEGAGVVVSDVNSELGGQTAEEIRRTGGVVEFIRADVSSADDVNALVARTVERFGRLDTVVNNAAATAVADAVRLSEADWDRTLDICLKSVFLTAHAAIPRLIEAGGGSIVNISSVNAIVTNPGFPAYSAAKAGMLGLTRNLALEFAHAKVRVNAICPGIIATKPFLDEIAASAEEEWAAHEVQPLPYWGTPEDVAWTAVFLASDESRFMTGATLVLDGGLTIQSAEAIVRPLFRGRWRSGRLKLADDGGEA
jgi:NAD(P)-dependent dehydrogenase (short-subunit alcohol dehydrogenase family)